MTSHLEICRGRESNPYSTLKIALWSKAFQLLLRPFLMPPVHCDDVASGSHPLHLESLEAGSRHLRRKIGVFPFGSLPSHGCRHGDASHGRGRRLDGMGGTHPLGRGAMAPAT